jgi:hypothetical protein
MLVQITYPYIGANDNRISKITHIVYILVQINCSHLHCIYETVQHDGWVFVITLFKMLINIIFNHH